MVGGNQDHQTGGRYAGRDGDHFGAPNLNISHMTAGSVDADLGLDAGSHAPLVRAAGVAVRRFDIGVVAEADEAAAEEE